MHLEIRPKTEAVSIRTVPLPLERVIAEFWSELSRGAAAQSWPGDGRRLGTCPCSVPGLWSLIADASWGKCPRVSSDQIVAKGQCWVDSHPGQCSVRLRQAVPWVDCHPGQCSVRPSPGCAARSPCRVASVPRDRRCCSHFQPCIRRA